VLGGVLGVLAQEMVSQGIVFDFSIQNRAAQ
jgi:hypothetical protein